MRSLLYSIFRLLAIFITSFLVEMVGCCPYGPNGCRFKIEKGDPPAMLPQSLWFNDPQCQNMTVQLAPRGTFPDRAAVGFPGTGTTWILNLIPAAAGYYSAIINFDHLEVFRPNSLSIGSRIFSEEVRKPINLWHVTEPHNGRTLMQFSHYNGAKFYNRPISFDYAKKLFKNNYGGILFVRNPWDAFISFKRTMDPDFEKGSLLKSGLTTDAMRFARGWSQLTKTWIDKSAPNDLLVVQYEKLVADPKSELTRILEYLNVPVSQDRMDCIEKYPFTEYKREPLKTEVANALGSIFYGMHDVNSYIQQSVNDINNGLVKRGVDDGEHLNYDGPTSFRMAKSPDEL